jgi:hypothetical protein
VPTSCNNKNITSKENPLLEFLKNKLKLANKVKKFTMTFIHVNLKGIKSRDFMVFLRSRIVQYSTV